MTNRLKRKIALWEKCIEQIIATCMCVIDTIIQILSLSVGGTI